MSVGLRPPASITRQPESHRRLDVQGLRAVAVLLVVLFHAGLPVPGGFVGVDVFFVISGFVITGMLMREWRQSGRIRFGRFYLRRFLRLTPALALLVTVVALASVLLQNPFGAQQTTARTGIGAMLLSANYVIGHAAGDYFAEGAATNPLLHTWSLSVEEQFYLVFPALLALGWVLARRRRLAPVAVVAAIALGSFALSTAWSFGSSLLAGLTDFFGGPESFAYYSSLTRAWEFAAGALLALVGAQLPHPSASARRGVGWAGAALLLVSAFTISEESVFPGIVALLPVLGTMLVIHAGTGGQDGVSRWLATRPMVAIGDLSYSWYLWHWPVIVFTILLFPHQPVLVAAMAAASFLPAAASYRFVEQPLRRLRPSSIPRAAGVIVPTVAVPIATCVVLLAGANTGWGLVPASSVTSTTSTSSSSDASSLVAGMDAGIPTTTDDPSGVAAGDGDDVAGGEGGSLRSQHALVRAGCVNTDLEPDRCRFGPTNAAGTVILAGDSQAYALADGVIEAAAQLGFDTVGTSHTGCPFLGRESSGVHNYPCGSWQRSIIDHALETKPAAVVIVNRSGGYVRPGKDWRTIARDDGRRTSDEAEAADLYRASLEPVVRELSSAGIPVVVVASVPEMVGYTNRTSLLGDAFGGQAFTVDRAAAEEDRRPAFEIEAALADSYPGAVVYDPNPALCDDGECAADRDGTPVYQDQYHLAVPGSLLLADGVRTAITAAIDEAATRPASGH